MVDSTSYVLADAAKQAERERLGHLESWADPITVSRLERAGVRSGSRCLEIGAGGGSIARWLAGRVGPTGSVLATDVNTQFLTDLPLNVAVRQHDLLTDDLDTGAYDVVHCRAVLQHTANPRAGLARLADAVAPGGWLLVEEADFGLLTMSGSDEAGPATGVLHDTLARLRAAGVGDMFFGRKLPGLVDELGWQEMHFDTTTGIGAPGDHVYETMRLGWPTARIAGAAIAGVSESDLACVDAAYQSARRIVTMTFFAAWARKPAIPDGN